MRSMFWKARALIRCRRGRIVIRNRDGLEAMAAESYGPPEACYRQLLGPFGKRGIGVSEPAHQSAA